MSFNNFLSYGGEGLESLQDGSTSLYVKNLRVGDLTPDLNVITNGDRDLVSQSLSLGYVSKTEIAPR